ncbi:MAG: SulP family inorganic anion transporter [Hyphomicrobiales bacterium]|nr:SulP family inorganic anion transporter [Hyphomicrobiales bacterium]MDE2017537.1 SulP family inorganic anion transporter [Hyphomicrobiales bacterium]
MTTAAFEVKPTPAGPFTPKLVTAFREGYDVGRLRADALAGLTVAIVALPLSMAIAIASGAKPEQGLYASIVGGVVVSALGGSRVQIGGPAGAFIVLVATTIATYGFQGFLVATMLAGLMLLALGYLRLGAYIRYIPHSVIVGFTAAIALIIFAGEVRDLLGLAIAHEPAPLWPKLSALRAALPSANAAAVGLSAACVAAIFALKRFAPKFPGMLVVAAAAALATFAFRLPVETIGSRFGGMPSLPPMPRFPAFPLADVPKLLPAAFAIALLSGIESLLSAVVGDTMTGRRHRANCELVAQGWANLASPLFGGLSVTGLVARTATNVRAHARTPVAGLFHSLFVLLFLLVGAPLAGYVPLAALAAVLATVCWNMVEWSQLLSILRNDRGEAATMAATFLVTVLRDLPTGIAVGVTLGAILFMHRMANMVAISGTSPLEREETDEGDGAAGAQSDEDVVALSIDGPLFYGAAASVEYALQRIGARPKAFVIDLARAPFADATAAHVLGAFARSAARRGAATWLAAASGQVRGAIETNAEAGVFAGFAPDVASAKAEARRRFTFLPS